MSVQYFSNSPKPKPIHIVSHTKYPLAPSTQDCTVIALCGTICTGDTPILFSTLRGLSMTDRVCPTCAGLSPEHSSAPKIIKTPDVERTLAHEVHMLTKMVCDLGNEVSKLKTHLDESRLCHEPFPPDLCQYPLCTSKAVLITTFGKSCKEHEGL